MESPFAAIAVLDDESRHGMFEYIRRSAVPVTRDEAAEAVGISRKLAAFHLDKLVDAGLLIAGSAAPAGRVGRRPKTYRLAPDTDLQVSIPQRRHDLLSEVLVDAVAGERAGESARDAAVRVARERGQEIGGGRRPRSGRVGAERAMTLAVGVLQENGFEPVRMNGCVRLRSCPFHPMADRARELVCGINHALVTGLVDGLRTPAIEALLEPEGGECCVELRAVQAVGADGGRRS